MEDFVNMNNITNDLMNKYAFYIHVLTKLYKVDRKYLQKLTIFWSCMDIYNICSTENKSGT